MPFHAHRAHAHTHTDKDTHTHTHKCKRTRHTHTQIPSLACLTCLTHVSPVKTVPIVILAFSTCLASYMLATLKQLVHGASAAYSCWLWLWTSLRPATLVAMLTHHYDNSLGSSQDPANKPSVQRCNEVVLSSTCLRAEPSA